MANELLITSVGAYAEQSSDQLLVTGAGAYAEMENNELLVSGAGAYAEMENNEILVTSVGAYVEYLAVAPAPPKPVVAVIAVEHKKASCITLLRSKKVPWAHRSNYLINPGWMGGTTKITSVSEARGRFDGRYVRNGGDVFGEFTSISRNMQAPSYSSVGLVAKERLCDIIYSWRGDIDLDIRAQSCGRVDDPVNWDRIKRLCSCIITGRDTDNETTIDPNDNGETMVNVDFRTNRTQLIIRRITPKVVTFYGDSRFSDYSRNEIIIGSGPDCGYFVPLSSGLYSMFSLAYWDEDNKASIGSGLLPSEPISISSNENVVVVVLNDGTVYWSSDYGKTFYLSSGVSDARVVHVLSFSNVIVGCFTGLYKSTDGGRTFYDVDPYNAADTEVVAICHYDDKMAYAMCNNASVSMSEDGGDSFMKMSTAPLTYPKDMVLMDGILIVGGYDAAGTPMIYGSDDNGCSWKQLAKFNGSMLTGTFSINPTVKLSSCGCGVVVALITYNDDGGLQHSQLYRNVNWGAPACWEALWEDYASYSNPNGMYYLTDVKCSCVNDVMAVGRILGDDPLYVGIHFYSEEVFFGEKWN